MIDPEQVDRIKRKQALQEQVTEEDLAYNVRCRALYKAIDDVLKDCTHKYEDNECARHNNICRICGDLLLIPAACFLDGTPFGGTCA